MSTSGRFVAYKQVVYNMCTFVKKVHNDFTTEITKCAEKVRKSWGHFHEHKLRGWYWPFCSSSVEVSIALACVLQTQGCNSSVVTQVVMDVVRDYSALSFGVSAESLTQLVSVSSHFTCNLLTAVTCTYSLSGMVLIYRRHSSLDLQCTVLVHFYCRFCTSSLSSRSQLGPSHRSIMAT